MYSIIFTPQVKRIFSKLDKKSQSLILHSLEKLAKDPFKKSNVKKLKNYGAIYRLRISRWRILYILFTFDKIIEVEDIFMKKGNQDYRKRFSMIL